MEAHPASWAKTKFTYSNGPISFMFVNGNIVRIEKPFERDLSFEGSQRVAAALVKANIKGLDRK